MDPAIISRLTELNREFYDGFAAEFSQSRQRLNEGIGRAVAEADAPKSILDLGCGDGRVGWAWRTNELGVLRSIDGLYVGVDQSRELLEARGTWPEDMVGVEADLLSDDWPERLPQKTFDLVVCFAALHHVPDRNKRVEFLKRMASVLAPGSTWVISVWQFLHLERFQKRIIDWSEIGLDAGELEEGDLLLDWRRGGTGLRYVHHFAPKRLAEELEMARLAPAWQYRSDGKTGDMGLYSGGRGPNSL